MGLKGRKGIVFTLDVIASLVVLVAAVGVVSLLQHSADLPSVQYGNMNSIALDSVAVLEKSKVRDVDGLPVVRDLLQAGILLGEDRNKTVMDVIGSLWAQGNLTMARNLTESMLKGYLPDKINYEIFMGDTLIYNFTPIADPRTKITASTAVSGYRIGVPTSGYLARAWIGSASGRETKIIEISPYGSGCSSNATSNWWCDRQGGNLTMIKSFELPSTAHDFNGTLYLSLHEEGGSIYGWLNDVDQDLTTYGEGLNKTEGKKKKSKYITDTIYDAMDVYGFRPGNNTLKILLTEPSSYHTHSHPGFVLVVNYTNEKNVDYVQEQQHYEVMPLNYVEGNPMAWGVFPFDIPAGSTINKVSVHVEGRGVNDFGGVYVNNLTVWQDTTPPLNPVVNADVTSLVYQQAGKNATGETNVLSIYFNIRKEDDRITNHATGTVSILNTSYIVLNYTLPTRVQKYGYMSFTQMVPFGGQETLIKTVNFSIGNTEIVSAYLHVAQTANWEIAAAAWHSPEAEPTWDGAKDKWAPIGMQVFKSPTGRNIPSSIYLRPDRLASNSTNFVKVRDGYGSGSPYNYILPNSTVEYAVLAPGTVGYGNVFNTSSGATSDALARLAALIAPYNLTYTAATESSNIAGISWLWSPTRLKVVIGS